ncbi:hypothetical protein Y032_0197g1570 [Ancylostoma ceylanicum]|uniref:Uncharacterized protein n=1 Tax=Ancylostoma ceylanicum TaxID=53326 RepID=A0A016SN96_9BILA|nr:hypothetical protein Y032_0197g1570 [Ancylostoma ceylanicum]
MQQHRSTSQPAAHPLQYLDQRCSRTPRPAYASAFSPLEMAFLCDRFRHEHSIYLIGGASVARGFTLTASRPTRLVDLRSYPRPIVSHGPLVVAGSRATQPDNAPATMYEDIKPNSLEFFNSRSRVKHLDAEEKIVFLFDYSSAPSKPSIGGANGPLLSSGEEVINWRVLRDL